MLSQSVRPAVLSPAGGRGMPLRFTARHPGTRRWRKSCDAVRNAEAVVFFAQTGRRPRSRACAAQRRDVAGSWLLLRRQVHGDHAGWAAPALVGLKRGAARHAPAGLRRWGVCEGKQGDAETARPDPRLDLLTERGDPYPEPLRV